jgi:transposase
MAPILFHGLNQLGLPVVCVESLQAYQALKSLATHKTDRNGARGLAHLARTGFFKPVHVKSLPAHAILSLISARKKLVGQRVILESDPRLGSCVRGPAPSRAHDRIYRPGSQSKRRGRGSVCRHARVDCGTDCRDECGCRDRRGHETHDKGLHGPPSPRPAVG